MRSLRFSVVLAGPLAAFFAAAALPAAADDLRTPPDPLYKEECGSCHVAYPPQLLPQRAWDELMSGLERHFGTNASLDPKTSEAIARYLAAHSMRRAVVTGAPPRITDTRWFRKEHDEVPPHAWTRPAVKSPANCAACHAGAEDGQFSDDDVRIPR